MSIERQRAVLQEQLDEIVDGIAEAKSARAERFTVKQLEKTKKQIKLKLEKLKMCIRDRIYTAAKRAGMNAAMCLAR